MAPATVEGKPLRGAQRAPEASVLLIPGRPQAKHRHNDGQIVRDAADAYLGQIKTLARRHITNNGPLHPDGPVAVQLALYYAFSDEKVAEINARHATWYLHSIPNADRAPTLILSALAGILYAHSSQVEPLTIARHIISTRHAVAEFGPRARRGAAIITWRPQAA